MPSDDAVGSSPSAPPGAAAALLDERRPLVVAVTADGPLDPVEWGARHREWVEETLAGHGAILFRGFGLGTAERLGAFAAALSHELPTFAEESSPRHPIQGSVYTSTDYPGEFPIQMHNEYSYAHEWPMKLFFGCFVPATSGGETPVASTRAVRRRLRASTAEAFRTRRILYVRNYRRGVGVSWQAAFRTDDPAEVDRHCARIGIETEWLGPDTLRTRQTGDAIVRHPRTGEELWFNHGFFFNVRALEPESLRRFFLRQAEDSLSTNTYFGDGTPIPDDVIEELRGIYAQEKLHFPWQAGDVLLIDNMLASHGRAPFKGPRNVAVVMGDRGRRA